MIKNIFCLLLAAILLQTPVFAQTSKDDRTVTTKIADLLAQLPANNTNQLNRNMVEVSQLGEDGYVTLINGLTAPGKGNNSLLEYAIGGYSAYVMQTGKDAERKSAVNAYAKALKSLKDKNNISFILTQLEIVGKDDAVPAILPYLTDAQLADPAARALVKVNSPAAKAALLSALSKTHGLTQLSIIEALGMSRVKEAVPALNKLANTGDQNLSKITLYALAHIGDSSSAPVMAAAADKAAYVYENTNAASAQIVYAKTLLNEGNKSLATQIAKEISEKAFTANQVHTRTAALSILAVSDLQNSTALLLSAMDDKDITYRAAALKFALPQVNAENSPLWISKLSKVSKETQAEIVNMLSQAKATNALPQITKLLKSKDQTLKIAAIDAVAQLGNEESLDDLYKVMRKGDSSTIAAVSNSISRMEGKNISQKVASFIPKSKPEVKIALVNILAARGANSEISTVYSLLKDKNPAVRKSAYAALKSTVNNKDLTQLFTLLNETADPAELTELQNAIVVAVNSGKNKGQEEIILQQMAAAPKEKKVYFYKILGNIGGEKALNAVSDVYYNGEAEDKKAALSALTAWKDVTAAPVLLKISSNNAEDLNASLNGYLGLVRAANFTPEQRLLKLREAMVVARTNKQKQTILKDLENAKCFPALLYAGQFLNDKALMYSAADAVMNIVLADASYNGAIVKDLVNKTLQIIKGADSEYQKEALRKYLSEMPTGDGFVSMYNGKNLDGWKGLVADPIKRSKMDAKTLATAQEKADAEAVESWKVLPNGDLFFANKGNNLASVKKYGDMEMYVDWKIIDDKKQEGDAGIYLRGTPQVQIWDNARVKVGAQVGSGGLYNNKIHPSKPLVVADNKLDEWNTFRIIMKGDRVTVYLNGVLVTDNVILENFWDRSMPIFAEEQIELQAHGSPVAYRDIYIREFPRVKPFELSAQEKKDGYKILFDGTNMHNWTGNTADYIIENGNMAIRPKPGKGSGGNLFTKEEYSDFVFRFEFKLTPGANNGLGIRAPLTGDAAYSGIELQILDSEAPIYKNLKIYQYHGSVYGIMPAKRGYLKPVGEWNYQEVVVKGPKIKVILNGTVILDGDITDARKNGAADGKQHPGLLRESGHIGFLGHGSPVEFKNIRIKDLSKK